VTREACQRKAVAVEQIAIKFRDWKEIKKPDHECCGDGCHADGSCACDTVRQDQAITKKQFGEDFARFYQYVERFPDACFPDAKDPRMELVILCMAFAIATMNKVDGSGMTRDLLNGMIASEDAIKVPLFYREYIFERAAVAADEARRLERSGE